MTTATRSLPSALRMYEALCARDASFEGVFVFGVKTTGIFCRPTCRSKIPRIENVSFFPSVDKAKEGGFRACLRCRPEEAEAPRPKLVKRLQAEIAQTRDGRLTEKELAALGIDPGTARRQFRRLHGVTFQAWQKAKRSGAVLASETIPTPLGEMLAIADDAGLRLLQFRDADDFARQKRAVEALGKIVPGPHPHLDAIRRELAEYFAGKRRAFTVPLAPLGTPFQEQVWKKLVAVPAKKPTTYAGLAKAVRKPGAARAIGGAVGANPILIAIPCHRVLAAGGGLGGFSAGIGRKKKLLALEGGAEFALTS